MVNSDDDSTLRPPLGRTLSGSMPPSHRLISVRSSFLLFLLYVPAYSDVDVSQPPFLIFWNAPTRPCLDSHGVAIDLSSYDIIINQNQSFLGPEVMIFYNNQLGLYPYYDQNDEAVNGGLPQNASLGEHLDKVHQDLTTFMADKNFTGVAVVDWEHWRPLWDRNWEGMLLYQQRSLQLLSQWHPNWSFGKLRKVAKRQFEAAAQDFMAATLQLCRQHRPGGLWGFYGFPECYNFENKNSSKKYSGRCPRGEVRRNDQQSWLWNISRALYPHIYLGRELQGSGHVRPFIRHRLQEAIRVSQLPGGAELPVLPYARIVYTHSMDFLTADSCLAVKSYVDETLGRYLKNVTTAVSMCSRGRCSGNGRCVRRRSYSDDHLHLDPQIFTIEKDPQGKGYMVNRRRPGMDAVWPQFQCRCYTGWRGRDCSQKGANISGVP
ncbi:hyaluronidase-1-like isoform X2 [Phyllobates terribilis]|uniref:hyaluronidase-1-like isoform X2 n=1 Tax=Phyllobates terribilis TaxID=111132 RepID=UPI003CCA7466